MKIKPIENKFGKPVPKPISFGIYKCSVVTSYGRKDIGAFRDKIITIHHDYRDNTKMWYVTNSIGKWIKSKLVYFQNGIKKIIWSKSINE